MSEVTADSKVWKLITKNKAITVKRNSLTRKASFISKSSSDEEFSFPETKVSDKDVVMKSYSIDRGINLKNILNDKGLIIKHNPYVKVAYIPSDKVTTTSNPKEKLTVLKKPTEVIQKSPVKTEQIRTLTNEISEPLKNVDRKTRSKELSKLNKTKDEIENEATDTTDIKTRRKVKIPEEIREIDKHLYNIREILKNSNATPIKNHTGLGYGCGFCPDQFPVPSDLKTHTLENHKNCAGSFRPGYSNASYVVKLDITGLKCEICEENFEQLDQYVDHLINIHDKNYYTDIKSHIVPFKFEGEKFNCVLCPNIYEHYKLLQEHMNIHFNNYTCEICGSPFINRRTLRSHMLRHKQGDFHCSYCSKVFDTESKKSMHEKYVHILGDHRRSKCPHCGEKFISVNKKHDHMVEVHGVERKVLKCMACDKTFTNRSRLTRHVRRDHLLERNVECPHCEKKFFSKKILEGHLLKHTGIKNYVCGVCHKAFGRKHTLKEHLRIHLDDRRFKCEFCAQAFVQKCSWKSHMRTRHDKVIVD